MPEVSIIVPVYNGESCLIKCLDSVFKQTLRSFEVIVVNDGSTDDTAAVARSYGNKIHYYEQKNAGQGAARNTGLSNTSGELIAFLDADDYWRSGFLEKCVPFLNEHPECVAVNTGLLARMHDGCEVIHSCFLNEQDIFSEPFVIEDFFAFWAKYDHVRTGSAVIRKSVIDQAGGQRADLRISQDLEYWGYIATYGKWGYIPEPLWVGNSRSAAASSGWFKKYKDRRRLCPSVESWQSRIIPRLKNEDIKWFEIVRGRIASSFAHNKILAGDYLEGLDIIRKYGNKMPRNRLTRLMFLGASLGKYGWLFTCKLIQLKENIKTISLSLKCALSG